MRAFVALLRGVNVGANTKIAMAELRALAGALGLHDVQTLLQSGNLAFRSDFEPAALEALLAEETAKRLGLRTDFLLRDREEWDAVIAGNPYPDAARDDPSHLVVMALRAAPDAAQRAALQAAIVGREAVSLSGRHAYIVYPDGIGRSKLTNQVIEARLGCRGTGRNWNTTLKLAELLRGMN